MGTMVFPSVKARREASSPSMNSSMTTRLPALPNLWAPIISSRAARASSLVMATTTPLPAARPSALITMGAPFSSTKALASARLSHTLKKAVDTPYFSISSLEKILEPSISAALALGPKMVRPRALNTSTIPATSGASGPTTVRSMACFSAQSARPSRSAISRSTHSARSFMPGFPGAA